MSASPKREMEVFDAALEIADPAERRAFLERECAGDERLRASVEDLLASQDDAEKYFAQRTPSLKSLAGQFPEWPSSGELAGLSLFEEKPGTVLGRYTIIRNIGEGGCGVVYEAEQDRPVRRRVALKVIKLGMDTRSVIARFEAERQALAIMDHPNIARVFDAGATETGRPYFVMELVNGAKVTEYCDENRLAIELRLKLFIQICQAIQHAHQKGIIHRDIKPSNILVTVHNAVLSIKVIDFGIAKATEERLSDQTIFTAYAQLIGTPAYMSPEQVDLRGMDLDTRSDIYSLGVLLYELLTGRTPFDSKELTKFGVEEMRRTLWEREPHTPSATLQALNRDDLRQVAAQRHVDPPQLATQLRGDLDWIVMKALEKDRSRRYDTASGLAMDVARFLENQPILARPPNRWYLLQKLVQRNRLAVAAGVAIAAILLVAAIGSTWLLLREREAQRKFLVAQQEARSRGEAEMLGRVAQAKLLLEQNQYEPADKLFDGIVLENPSADAAAVLRKLGRWHAVSARWRQAADRFALLAHVNRLDSLELVTIDYFELGPALIKAGDLNGYERARQEGIARYAGSQNAYLDLILKFSLLLPANQQVMKDLGPQAGVVEKAVSLADVHRSQDTGSEAWHAMALALFEYRRGDFAKAAEWCRRCLDYRQYVAPRSAAAEAILSMSRWQMNQHEDALAGWCRSRAMIAGIFNAPAEQKVGPDYFWFDMEFARILFRECEERFSDADHSLAQTAGSKPSTERSAMYRVLGEWRALRDEWRVTGERFTALASVNQRAIWEEATLDLLGLGVTLAKLEDRDSYERFRTDAISRFKDTDNKTVAERIIKVSLLRPADDTFLASLQPLEAVAVRPFSSTEGDLKDNVGFHAWNSVSLGLLEYRRGHWDQAADWARRGMAATNQSMPLPLAIGRVVLAMSLHRLGQSEAARTELRQARDYFEGNAKYVDQSNWRDFHFGNLLLREAIELMPDAPKAP